MEGRVRPGRELMLVQPSWRRREHELRDGDEVVGRLRWPGWLGSSAVAEADGHRWELKRSGFLRSLVVVSEGGAEAARLERRKRKRELVLADGRTAAWKRLGRKEGAGFVAPDGTVAARFRRRGRRQRLVILVEPDTAYADDAALLALLGGYVSILDAQAAAAGSTAAVTAAT